MLASAPPSTRVHTGGGISVRVNGAIVDSQKSVVEESAERLTGNVSSADNAGNSEWAKATITWRNGAQRISEGNSNLMNNNNNNASSSVDINGPAPQLVHVIRVKPSDPGKVEMDSGGNGAPAANKAQICITSKPNGTYVNNSVDYCKGKISVMVGSSINQVIKGEDERSSSGASSAPGSDSERSDSDREADDGTDSGFCLSERHCARVSVTANTIHHSSSVSNTSINESLNESPAKNNNICNGNGNNVRLTISSYSDKDSETKKIYASEDNCNMHFHLRELDTNSMDKKHDSEDVQTKIASAHAMLSGQGNNDGACNFKNKVRSSIVSLLVQSASNRNFVQEEKGRVVFYTTSVGIIRSTYERCRKVHKILETLMVRFDERDVFMNKVFQQELRERLGTNKITLPQLFVEGRHLGNAEVVEQLNEIGELREILRPYKRQNIGGVCRTCGGFKYLLCSLCGGSKKAQRHQFSDGVVSLRCVSCDEGGLIRCSQCMYGGEY